jgi:hypothetical protein
MRTLYKHGGSHKGVPEMTPEQIKARDAYVEKLRKKREEQDKIKTQVDEELFGYAGGGKYYPHGGKHEEEEGMGTKVMNFMQDKYNQYTGKGPQPIPAEEFESANQNYSGMDEVVDWMLEQKSQGMGPGFETPSLEKLRSGESRDPNATNYMPAPSPDDIERKAMMFSNALSVLKDMNSLNMDRPLNTDQKRDNVMKVFQEQQIPEEWQNEFFEAFRVVTPSIVQSSAVQQMPGREAQPIETPRTSQSLQMTQTPISMPETQRRGIFRRGR